MRKKGQSDRLYSLPKKHVVQQGDTISGIALQYGISQSKIKQLNNLDDNKILLGQELAVLDARVSASDTLNYTIKRGDTLSQIAERYNVRVADITFSSGVTTAERVLIPGQTLQIHIR